MFRNQLDNGSCADSCVSKVVAIIDKIQREVVKIYRDPAVSERLEKAGITAVTSTPAEFDAFFRKEAARWTKVFKDSGIKLD